MRHRLALAFAFWLLASITPLAAGAAGEPTADLAGTEPAVLSGPQAGHAQPLDAELARILSPAAGTRLALDPDIPRARQRVLVQASAADQSLELLLDGQRLGSAEKPILWPPRRGRHRLTLLAPDGSTLDAASFTVR